MAKLWLAVEAAGRRYGVDPTVFAVLYILHHPLFWGTIAWVAGRYRRRQPIAGLLALAAAFYVMPYGYVLICSRGLPLWAYALVAVAAAAGGTHAWRLARRRLRQSPDP